MKMVRLANPLYLPIQNGLEEKEAYAWNRISIMWTVASQLTLCSL
jgi:hypothetical protein